MSVLKGRTLHRKQKSAFVAADHLSKTFNHSVEGSFDPEMSFSVPNQLHSSQNRGLKWANPLPLYKNYRGKYPNALFKQKDTQLSILHNALQSLLTKMSQLAARFATVSFTQPENVTFFNSLTCKSQSLLIHTFEDTHSVLIRLLSSLLLFLHINLSSSLRIRSVQLFASSRKVLQTPSSSQTETYESNIALLKPTVRPKQVYVLRGLTKEYETEAKTSGACFIGWGQATEFIQLIDEARFKITKLEELHQTYQTTYEKEHPETRFLQGNNMSSVFAERVSAVEATTKDRLKYLRKLVRRTREPTSISSKPVDQLLKEKKSLSMDSLLAKQRSRAEKAMISGVQMSTNQALTSSVRMLLFSRIAG